MNVFSRIAIAAVLVVAVGTVAINVILPRSDGSSVGGPSPSPSSSPAVAVGLPKPDTTFVSPTNGFSFEYYDRGGLEPAKALWDPVNQEPFDQREFASSVSPINDGFDLVETGFGAAFMGASTPIPDGVAIDPWIDSAIAKYLKVGCRVPRSEQAEITIDGQPGRTSECEEMVMATVVAERRLYLFVMLHTRTDAPAVFDAFAATIHLRPEEVP